MNINTKGKQITDRIKAIEGLRGICAIIVVLNHFMVGFFPSSYWGAKFPSHTRYNIDTYLSQSPLSLFYAGNFGVCMFCMISGFVITHTFYNDNNKMNKIAINRYLRLCIPVLISTLISFYFMKLSLFYTQEASIITGSKWLGKLYDFEANFMDMISVTLFDVFFIGNSKYNTVFWMMSMLFYGSFLSFMVLNIWGHTKNRQIIYVLLIIVLFKLNKAYYIAFILGIICADIYINYSSVVKKNSNTILIISAFIIGIYFVDYPKGVVPTNIFYSWLVEFKISSEMYHTLGAFLILISVICSEWMQRILSMKQLQYLGRISFSIYLTHIIVLCSFSSFLFINMWTLTQKYQLSFVITFIPSIIVIIVFAHLFHKIIEKNSNKIISKIYDKLLF